MIDIAKEEYRDCCVIIRGLPTDYMTQTIKELRKTYDGEIIYSTWEGTVVPELKGVEIVLSKDPQHSPIQSIKRVMMSVMSALKETEKKKIFVIRSDVPFVTPPFHLYKEGKVCFSSIMSLPMSGFCSNAGKFGGGKNMMSREHTRFNREWFCRFGDLFHLGSKRDMIKLFSYFTKEQEEYFLRALPRCTEQWMFYKYMTEKVGYASTVENFPKFEYDKFIVENVEILNLSDISGKFSIGCEQKYDYQYYDKSCHFEYKNRFNNLEIK